MDKEWKKIKSESWQASGESKSLLRKKVPDPKYPYRFQVVWQWSGCHSNSKTMWNEEKALRLFNCIDIQGWPNHLNKKSA